MDNNNNSNKVKIIFFGNGLLAEEALVTLAKKCDIIFHARTAADLATAKELKLAHPEAYGVLASFGIIIKADFLALFEPVGIINLHPSKLPQYRGPSPIESAILAGDSDFSYSIMKLIAKMDAGPIYHQATLPDLPLDKTAIYQALAAAGASYIQDQLQHAQTTQAQPFSRATPQDEALATYTKKLDKSMSNLHPEAHTAAEILRQIIAFQGYPKPKYDFYGQTCIIHAAHLDTATPNHKPAKEADANVAPTNKHSLFLECKDKRKVFVDSLQPAGKKVMTAQAFINGYGKNH